MFRPLAFERKKLLGKEWSSFLGNRSVFFSEKGREAAGRWFVTDRKKTLLKEGGSV
ncbi:hypothetical protein MPNT_90050 [Candidatus Methylacidithermus pantelleriae]|uniref:Uncharacterized protein n=1 Tax=Candidatus Methylacidithermus pantelleriae TaxID=2744239 RepID=A0A8J2BLP1_9BACT|nr:hypothetical protein MPNT_90050 [Candidatus Methylacidithermus pantelleriae]